MRALLPRIALVIGAVALAAAGADCTNLQVHVFGGYVYDPTQDCLETPGALDVVEGPMTAPCPAVRCWIAPDGTVVVTDEACDAPPDYKDETTAASGPCVDALAAYAAYKKKGGALCPASPDAGAGGSA